MFSKAYRAIFGLFLLGISTPIFCAETEKASTKQCPVCLEEEEEECFTPLHCGHLLCSSCVKDMAKETRTHSFLCPKCRSCLFLEKEFEILSQRLASLGISKKIYEDKIISFTKLSGDEHLTNTPHL